MGTVTIHTRLDERGGITIPATALTPGAEVTVTIDEPPVPAAARAQDWPTWEPAALAPGLSFVTEDPLEYQRRMRQEWPD